MVRRLSRPRNWSQLTTGGGTHHLRYLDNPACLEAPFNSAIQAQVLPASYK